MKVREENYEWLSRVAGELQGEKGRPVSIDEALSWLRNKGSMLEFAGSWNWTEKESADFLKKARAGWKKWKPRFA